MSEEFRDIKIDFDIERQKGDFQEEESIPLLKVGRFLSDAENKEFEARQSSIKAEEGIGVLQMSNIKTHNSFINTVQQNEQDKIKKETKRVKNANTAFPYVKCEIMTNAEKQLFHFMINNLDTKDRICIFPKVRLADIIEVDSKISRSKQALYKIAYKHVDYVICRADTLELICVVELDDFTHDNKTAREKDLFVMEALYTAGIEVVRVKVPIRTICKEDLEYLDERLNTALAPNCQYCGIKMVPKKNMSGANKGHRFFSCPNFLTGCRYTVDIDQGEEKLP